MTSISGGKPDVRIGEWLSEGWNIIRSDLGAFVLASLIYNLILFTCLGGLILYGPLTCGMYLMAFDKMKGGKTEISRLFGAFDRFGESFIAGLIFFIVILVSAALAKAVIGFVILVLAQTAFLFTFQLILLQRRKAVEGITISFDKVRENFMQFALFALVLVIINSAGFLLIIGWLITTPLVVATLAIAYRDVFGLSAAEGTATSGGTTL